MPTFFYTQIYQFAQATFELFGSLPMAAIFPATRLKARQGFVREREKDARRVPQAQRQPFPQILRIEPLRSLKAVASNSAEGDDR
jgi:hypothetical protein